MANLFSPAYQWLWTALLATVLFFPARQMIWVMMVRREERKCGSPTDEARRRTLHRRASVTSAILCLAFSLIYVHAVFARLYGPHPS